MQINSHPFLQKLFLRISSLLVLFLAPTSLANAHLRWFVDIDSPSAKAYQAAGQFHFDIVYLILLAGAVGFVIIAIMLDNLARKNKMVDNLLNKPVHIPFHLEWRLVSILLGLMLMLNSHHGVLLAPNLPTSGAFTYKAAIIAQFVVGLLFLSQLSFVLSAIGTFCLATITAIITPFEIMIDYVFEFGGIILAFYLIGPSMCRLDRILWPAYSSRNERLAVGVLALALGAQLAELALHNKLMNPGLALIFMDDNSYLNFMLLLGFSSFDNIYFVFAAAIAELTLGTLLVFGVATRLVALGIGGVFMLTATIFGLHELLGHIPIMAVVLLVVLHGRDGSFLDLLRRSLIDIKARA